MQLEEIPQGGRKKILLGLIECVPPTYYEGNKKSARTIYHTEALEEETNGETISVVIYISRLVRLLLFVICGFFLGWY